MILNPVGYPLLRGQCSHDSVNAAIAAAIATKAPKVATYTVATLPAASAANAGAIVYVSNGNAGAPCLAYSTGTAWAVVALGAAPATA